MELLHDTSPEKLESTTQPLKAQQARSNRNLKHRPPEDELKIISTQPKAFVTSEAILQKFVPYSLIQNT